MQKINVAKPLVVLHGDEMAQIAFERILDQFVRSHLDIELIELDLSAENRLLTNGKVIREAIATLITHGIGIKNAGMTVNRVGTRFASEIRRQWVGCVSNRLQV